MESVHIIKVGGNVIEDKAALASFVRDFAALPGHKILVHGGGQIATKLGKRLGLTPQYVAGRRITDQLTLELVTMVYGGLVNRRLVAQLQAAGCNAMGLTGADANLLLATKRPVTTVDYGWVGNVKPDQVDTTMLRNFWNLGITPVFAPLTHDGQGHLLNTNADTIATVIARALAPFFHVNLLFCFEKPGILRDPSDDASVLPCLNRAAYRQLQEQAAVSGGILPKLDNAFAAVENGVARVIIGSAGDLLQNTTATTPAGTHILP